MNIAKSIKKSGFRINFIAEECGVSRQTIFHIDKGIVNKKSNSYKKVMRVLQKRKIKLLKKKKYD